MIMVMVTMMVMAMALLPCEQADHPGEEAGLPLVHPPVGDVEELAGVKDAEEVQVRLPVLLGRREGRRQEVGGRGEVGGELGELGLREVGEVLGAPWYGLRHPCQPWRLETI